MKTCLIVIDVQESFRHRPFFTERDLPAFSAFAPEHLNPAIDHVLAGYRADVERLGGGIEDVAEQAADLAVEHADQLTVRPAQG